MSNPENVFQLGPNAYGKPTALNILRETIMGRELFDYAFKTYWMDVTSNTKDFSVRWKTPRSWFGLVLEGWFYTTDFVDIGVESLNTSKQASLQLHISKDLKTLVTYWRPPALVSKGDEDYDENAAPFAGLDAEDYLDEAGLTVAQENLEKTNYLYEITFNKPGGLVMPILVEYTYADGSTLTERYPVQIWRKNDDSYTRLLASEKEIVGVQVDPNEETADVNTTNNSFWNESSDRLWSF